MVVILPQLSSHGRWFFNTECPAFVLLTHDAPLMTTHSRGFHPSKNLPAFSSACFPYLPSRLLAASHMCANLLQEPPHLVPHLELPFPGPAEPFPAVIGDSGRAEQLPPRKPSRRRPSPSSPPPELSSWSRAVPPCLRASAVPPVAPPRCAAPWGASPSRFRYRALIVDERLNGQRTRSARLGAHLAALRDSTSAARSQEAASPLHGHHCRRNRPFHCAPLLQIATKDLGLPRSKDLHLSLKSGSLFLLSPVTPVSYISAGDAPRLTPDPLP